MVLILQVAELLAQGVSPATRQEVLVALSALATAHGKQRPKEMVAVLPVVLAQVRFLRYPFMCSWTDYLMMLCCLMSSPLSLR